MAARGAPDEVQHHDRDVSRLRLTNPNGYQGDDKKCHITRSPEFPASGTDTTIVLLSPIPKTSCMSLPGSTPKSNSPASFVCFRDTVSPLDKRLTGMPPIPWPGFMESKSCPI